MDAQGRRRAGDIDPADQWVFNPDTGSYELQATDAADGSESSYGSEAEAAAKASSTPPRPRRERPPSDAPDTESEDDSTIRRVPAQRRRRAASSRSEARDGSTGTGPRSRPGSSRRKPKPKRSKKKRALIWGSSSMGMLLIAGCATVGYMYWDLNNNIHKVDVGEHNPAVSDGPMNILLVGTDTRKGKGNKGYGDTGSVGHADTTLILHVSDDRSNATVLSIPRDMIVDIPTCKIKQEDGSTKTIPGAQNVRFNRSLGQRGRNPKCTWETVEKVTGIELNHFMMADFNAVKKLSTAVGGVEVCVTHDINDEDSGLKMEAGRHVIQGEKALAFVRTRHSVGTGSDLSRIKLQQQFLSSMIRKMKSTEVLTDPGKLWDLAEVATKSLTVDTGIGSIDKLVKLAKDLRRVDTNNITFLTTPVLDNPNDPATVIMNEKKARPIFKMIKQDESLTKTKKDEKKKKDKGDKKDKKALTADKVPAADVRVDVLNGGADVGAAQGTVTWLQNDQGVPLSTNAGNAEKEYSKTRLEYAPNQAGQAATLAAMMGLPDSALKETSGKAGPQEPMTLILGGDFPGPGQPIEAPEKAPEGVDQINASDKSVCAS